ncbi:hypothetical protein [Streptomyces sp. NPDC047014]|uniref:hypothetical protein n=1 Tax=Streptomyces sp. NPDC047014 TaxID=3155736 RepID=UPI0034024741
MSRPAGGAVRSAGWVACLVLAAGCSSSGPAPEQRTAAPRTVEIAEACPGLLNEAAAQAVERTLQSSALVRDEGQAVGAEGIGAALEAAYKAGPAAGETAVTPCVMTGQVGGGDRRAELRLGADSGGPGVRVRADARQAAVSFDCVSTRVGSTTDLPLRITSTFTDHWQKTAPTEGPPDTYLTVAHSAALAMAQHLSCDNTGNLPPRPTALPPPSAP